MKIVTSAEMRELDRRTIEEYGRSGEELMDRAGHYLAEQVRQQVAWWGDPQPVIQCVAGRGNNGGDAFVAARYLHEYGFAVEVCLAVWVADVRGDARTHLLRLQALDIPLYEWGTPDDWATARRTHSSGDIVIDGLLGTGTSGPPRGPVAEAIAYINAHRERSWILAIDVPSGLDPDTGLAPGVAVRADLTVAMGLPKPGLIAPGALDFVGRLSVADIGFPSEYVEALAGVPATKVIHRTDLYSLFPRRSRTAHKGDFGHVLVLGGSVAYPGAPALAARAALRGGAGRVSVWVPAPVAPTVAVTAGAEAIVRGKNPSSQGSLAGDIMDAWSEEAATYQVIVAGPGMTTCDDTTHIIQRLLAEATCPVVLDADALRVVVGHTDDLRAARAPLIVTPHPGEFAALRGMTVAEVQADRLNQARAAAQEWNAVVVLKGALTVVASPDGDVHINLTGNPGMATGGTGDVLAGLTGALLGQGQTPLNAARAAVYLHGKAGDLAAADGVEASLTAMDCVEELPRAWRAITMG